MRGVHGRRQPLGEGGGDPFLNEEPVRRGAGLAAVAHLGDHGSGDRRIDVGVVEDDEGCIAAELHR